MESKDELKEIDIKKRTCYYFDQVMRVKDIDFSDILLDENSYKRCKNILIYDTSYNIFMGTKPLHISYDEIDGFIRYLVLIASERYNKIYDRVRYVITKKWSITDFISH